MSEFRMRRVVTGHTADGKAIVAIDEIAAVSAPQPERLVGTAWANDTLPADNLDPRDGATLVTASRMPNGATFRVVQHAPGAVSRMHRTQTLDYGVIISGSIVLELDDNAETTLNTGDLLVQRGTIHRWRNEGSEPCVMAVVLLDAVPLPFRD